jgi:hypothetical protein
VDADLTDEEVFDSSADEFFGHNPMAGSPSLADSTRRLSLEAPSEAAQAPPSSAEGEEAVVAGGEEAKIVGAEGAADTSADETSASNKTPTLVAPPDAAVDAGADGADGDVSASDSGLDTPIGLDKVRPKSPGNRPVERQRRSFFEKKKKARRHMSIVSHSGNDGGRKVRASMEGYLEKKSTVSGLLHL